MTAGVMQTLFALRGFRHEAYRHIVQERPFIRGEETMAIHDADFAVAERREVELVTLARLLEV
jgi:hypothetical protein